MLSKGGPESAHFRNPQLRKPCFGILSSESLASESLALEISVSGRVPSGGFPVFGIPVFGIPTFGIPAFGIPTFGICQILRAGSCRTDFSRIFIFSSESKCHFLGVIFCRVPGALPLHQRKGILLPPGAFQGAFQKMTLVFPCFAVYATYEQVSLSHAYMGRFQGTPCFWAAGFFRGFSRRIFSPHFCGKKCPEKSSRKIPGKILQSLYNKNPRHISAEGPG